MALDPLSSTFAELADPRGAILARLISGEATVNELAEPHDMSLPAIFKHLKVLERSGLIRAGQRRAAPSMPHPQPLKAAEGWLEDYRRHWEQSLDRLEDYLKELQMEGKGEDAWPKQKSNFAEDTSDREIVKPEKIVLIQSFSDENGDVTRAPMSATWTLETLSTTAFTEKDGRTTLKLEWCPINATEEEIRIFAAAFDGMTTGWSGTMEQLTDYLCRYTSGIPKN